MLPPCCICLHLKPNEIFEQIFVFEGSITILREDERFTNKRFLKFLMGKGNTKLI